MLNNHRPISSYHRNVNTDNQNKNNLNNNLINEENNKNSYKNNKDSNLDKNSNSNANANSLNGEKNTIQNNSPPKNIHLNHKEIMERLNSFIKKKKIKKDEFIESEEIFLSKEDFKDIFRKLRFDISKDEINFLFHFNNNYSANDFIRMKNFLDLHNFEFDDLKTEVINESEKKNMKKINEEFKNLHVEILDIIKNEMIEEANKEKIEIYNGKNFKSKQYINRKPITNNSNRINTSSRPQTAIQSEKKSFEINCKSSKRNINISKNDFFKIENSDSNKALKILERKIKYFIYIQQY